MSSAALSADTSYRDMVERVMVAMDQMTSGIENPEQWLVDALGGSNSSSGVTVNEYTSLGYPPLWYAVNKIAGHMGTMPLQLRRKLDSGSEVVDDDPRVGLIARPNDWQNAMVFRETMQTHALMHGNGRALIVRDSLRRPVELIPLLPESTRTVLTEGRKFHWWMSPTFWEYSVGPDRGTTYLIPDEDVLHVPGLGWNGAWGVSLLHVAREAIGLGLAGQQAASMSFANLGRPGIILEAPIGKFRDPKKAQEYLDAFDKAQRGIDNVGKSTMLREGVQAKVLPISNHDAQFLEQRRFQREDTALLFLLESILGDNSGQTYKSITERNTQYLTNCLSRWIIKTEQEYDRKLLFPEEQDAGQLCFKFDPHALLEGDPNSLADYTGKLRQQGVISGNEAREMHRLNMVEDEMLDAYSNPNTSAQSAPPTTPEDTGDDDSEAVALNERLVGVLQTAATEQCTYLVDVESRRVVAAAGNKPNFNAWVDDFYGEWQAKMERVVTSLGGGDAIAQQHCSQSMQQLKEVAAVTSVDQLADNVQSLVQQWPARAASLVNQIIEGATSNA